MGQEVIIIPSRNKAEIMAVLQHPSIWEYIGGIDGFDFNFDLQNIFILGRVDDATIGCAIFHSKNIYEWKIHFNVIAEHRKKYASEFLSLALDWFWSKAEVSCLYADIDDMHQNVQMFAERHGFVRQSISNRFRLERPE